MPPIREINKVQRTPEILPPILNKKKTNTPTQTIVSDSASKLTKLSDLHLSGAIKKVGLQKIQAQQTPVPSPKQPDTAVDGYFLGKDGVVPPTTPLKDVKPVEPTGGVRNKETIIYTNGILTNSADQAGSLQAIADQTGSRVIGVRNATEKFEGSGVTGVLGTVNGVLRDGDQVFNDKFGIGKNPAVDTLADTVYKEINAGRGVHLMAHSQGGTVTSRALNDVKNRLIAEDGLTKQQAEQRLGLVKVETFAAAAATYPDGPQYVHYVNRNDAVPQSLGLSEFIPNHPGQGAVTHYFQEGPPVISHGFEDYYLKHRVPFEEAQQKKFKEPEAPELNPLRTAAINSADFVREKAIETGNLLKKEAIKATASVALKAIETSNFLKQKAVQTRDYLKEKSIQTAANIAATAIKTTNFLKEKADQAGKFIEDKVTTGKALVDASLTVAKNFANEKINQAKTITQVGFSIFKSMLPWNR